jgi:hypothetical protein
MSLLSRLMGRRPAGPRPSHVDAVIYPGFAAYLRRHYGVQVSREAFDRAYSRPALRDLIVRRALEDGDAGPTP